MKLLLDHITQGIIRLMHVFVPNLKTKPVPLAVSLGKHPLTITCNYDELIRRSMARKTFLPDWSAITNIPGASLHLYGKREARKGRKMGHAFILGKHIEEVTTQNKFG